MKKEVENTKAQNASANTKKSANVNVNELQKQLEELKKQNELLKKKMFADVEQAQKVFAEKAATLRKMQKLQSNKETLKQMLSDAADLNDFDEANFELGIYTDNGYTRKLRTANAFIVKAVINFLIIEIEKKVVELEEELLKL